MNSNGTHYNCVHCACNSPLLQILKDDLSNPDYTSQLVHGLEEFISPTEKSIVFSGGVIYPLIDGNMETVDAIAFHRGKVVVSGSLETVENTMRSQGINYEKRVLKPGETLLPGLIDPHAHLIPTALMRGWEDFGAFDGQTLRKDYNLKWLEKAIKEKIPKDKSRWILGLGVDPSLMPLPKTPGKQGLNQLVKLDYTVLDPIVSDVGLFLISASGHTAYVNTKVLEEIYYHNDDLKKKYGSFDAYRQETQGVLHELDNIRVAARSIPKGQVKKTMLLPIFKHLKEIFDEASSRGITMLYDAGMTRESKILLELYLRFYQKKVRIGCAHLCQNLKDAQRLHKYEPVKEYKDIYQGNIKLVSDGSNQGLTGYQSKFYCCEPADNKGNFNFPANSQPKTIDETGDYIPMLKTIAAKGWPLMIHANGDKAVQFALEAYDSILEGKKGSSKRHRIEHCSLLTQDNIKTMNKLGISPSFLIGHVGYWGYAFAQAIFEGKAQMLDLCKSALRGGLRITLHSDHFVSPLGPLRMMEQAITRRMEGAPEKQILNPNERLSPEEALIAVTYDAAWQCHADEWVGSLKSGYYADFVILEQDPLNMQDYIGMRDIKVLETWKGGVQVYSFAPGD